jgi:hypothetical protein
MAVMLVLYEMEDQQKRNKMINTLRKRHRIAVKLTETAYAVYTSLLPVKVFDEIRGYLEGDDVLYVIPITRPFTGYGPRKATAWLNDCLPG